MSLLFCSLVYQNRPLFWSRAAATDTFEDYVMPVARHGLDRQTAEYRSRCISEYCESEKVSGTATQPEQLRLQ
ncbi:hypothetical protein ALQ08_04211 [Pseudomonas syringae pv. delphinii]|uniref:Uncharacterized protein n=1 Tax=Pseudomonas syringae pv. delphinii TaxID=192088 RepID=A0A0P9QE41_9PSED|nr:Uncharacterized protein ALO72_04639 [Pseudomonas syringae pv. delphinii]RMP08754.1 hypothetical protein ALQ28_04812 [Pseudomonas syringae pv. delphinii]RMP28178.1 hypothetical protein ALQ27_04509 [Pseudomonas syringae pv. delphinii]RMQ22976.1 hypothetical protein ALQ08_04211 [Pseudomonas syringae pv. delphinii]